MDSFLDKTLVERHFGAGTLEHYIARQGFERCIPVAAKAALQNYKGSWLRNRLLNDRGRYMASILLLDLHFNVCAGRGMTDADLRRDVVAWNICSAGRATAFLAALRFGQFVEEMPTLNRRERRLRPTRKFLEAHRMRWNTMFSAIGQFDPVLADRALAAPDALIFGPALSLLAGHIRGGVRIFDSMPRLRVFADSEGGFITLLSLLVLAPQEAITSRQIRELCSISRTHAANQLHKAEQEGFSTAVERGFIAGPSLIPAFREFFGLTLLIFDHAFRKAEAMTDEPVRAPA